MISIRVYPYIEDLREEVIEGDLYEVIVIKEVKERRYIRTGNENLIEEFIRNNEQEDKEKISEEVIVIESITKCE